MLKGSIVALITPFNEDNSVNFAKLEKLIEYHIANKTDGIVILGTTAEASTLNDEERIEVVKFALEKINKRVSVVVGASSNDTAKAVKMAKLYSGMGADYILSITPYYNKTNQSGLIKHFEAVAEASTCPIILYNVPSRTGMSISIEAIKVLSQNKNIYGIKEASGNISYASLVSKYLSDDFIMLSGNDDVIVPYMAIGAKGVISVLANICPNNTHKLCQLCLEQNYKAANKLQNELIDVANSLFLETNPIPVKAAMNYLGFGVGKVRLPLDEMSTEMYEKMTKIIDANKELID